jgi:hypothetical protein
MSRKTVKGFIRNTVPAFPLSDARGYMLHVATAGDASALYGGIPEAEVTISWEESDEHKCQVMERVIWGYRIRHYDNGAGWRLEDGCLSAPIVACPFCGEKLL